MAVHCNSRNPVGGKRGVVLVFAAGILAILAALGTSFYAITYSSTMSAVRYSDMVRVELLAHAGLHDAVCRLRELVYAQTEDPSSPWFMTNYLEGGKQRPSFVSGLASNGRDDDGDGTVDNAEEANIPFSGALGESVGRNSDRYLMQVEDAASKININACDNLAVVLDNLCRLIGPPLVSADEDLLQPRRWYIESGNALTAYQANTQDVAANKDIYYELDTQGRPLQKDQGPYSSILSGLGKTVDGSTVFGDGYAIAGFRSRNGPFQSIDQLKGALTYIERNGNGRLDDPLEVLEVEVKFAALRPYVTTHSWIDTSTVCVGKFEWVSAPQNPSVVPVIRKIVDNSLEYSVPCQILIDRDKSWVADKPISDSANERGSLRGSYVSIMNGHGAGQLRRILTNGTDWIAVRGYGSTHDKSMKVPPGPISSYMIIAREDARVRAETGVNGVEVILPVIDDDTGVLVDDPAINYSHRPLCIHRAPVNINTASDKVLAAVFMGINVQHGHPQAVGTDADLAATGTAWKIKDYAAHWPCLAGARNIESYVLSFQGLKRVPVSDGKLEFDGTKDIEDVLPAALKAAPNDLKYITCEGLTGLNEAHELAARIISARTVTNPSAPELDPFTTSLPSGGFTRRPFSSVDDFYFRVVRPWDDERIFAGKASIAPMIMAMVNSNTDILKFNPNIEWIDRWGRNFTEMEPVMIYTNDLANNGKVGHNTQPGNPLQPGCAPLFAREVNVPMPGYSWNPVTLADFWHWVLESNKAANRGDGAFLIRSQRYKSDELIDKTDLNRSTTEFSFGSNGIFEIVSTGQVLSGHTGQLLAERKIEAIVKVYDVWRESNQAEFVNGEFMEAANQSENGNMSEFARSGRITRDGVHGAGAYATKPVRRLAINSQPEPLVPLNYTLQRSDGIANAERVDPAGKRRDAYGREKADVLEPDILANDVLPARYDGQLVLAVNTPRWDPGGDKDSFLANFVGDLDTVYSSWNGREQSKIPNTVVDDGHPGEGYKYRVVDTFGLLGLLNDTLVDVDPDLPNRDVYCFATVNAGLGGLAVCDPADPDKSYYYNNVTLRMGDLRPEGVFLSNSGISGRDATLKYLIGDPGECPAGDYVPGNAPRQNFNPNATEGWCVSMWLKPTWHQNDFRRHEFFNAGNPGYGANSRACFFAKEGRYHFAGDVQNATFSNNARLRNDLHLGWESQAINYAPGSVGGDNERSCAFFGGSCYVPKELLPDPTDPTQALDRTKHIESPAYYVQPFRWHYLGARGRNFRNQPKVGAQQGHWRNTSGDAIFALRQVCGGLLRPFISTSLLDEKDFSQSGELMWGINSNAGSWIWRNNGSDIGHKGEVYPGSLTSCCTGGWRGQDAKWDWADPVGINPGLDKVFSINNLNYGKAANNTTMGAYQYRHMPDEGTYAVIDCLKISFKSNLYTWDGTRDALPAYGTANLDNDRAYQEMTLSRYYVPANPNAPAELPWFKSQTLSSFTRGAGSTPVTEEVSVARVTWNGFAPRFMHEYKQANGRFKRDEYITYDKVAANQRTVSFNIRGPFDIRVYNDDAAIDDVTVDNGRKRSHASVARPYPMEYPGYPAQAYHAAAGFEVDLVEDNGTTVTRLHPATFTNPDALNYLGTAEDQVRVRADRLRYLVRFRYPIDPLVDPLGGATVDSGTHYMLDTMVFDDISVTYFSRVRFLSYRHLNE